MNSPKNNQLIILAIVFLALACVAPLWIFAFVAAGFMPLIALIYSCFSKFPIPGMIYTAIYTPILYIIARRITILIFSLPSEYRVFAIIFILAMAILLSFAPMFGISHNDVETFNVYKLFSERI